MRGEERERNEWWCQSLQTANKKEKMRGGDVRSAEVKEYKRKQSRGLVNKNDERHLLH